MQVAAVAHEGQATVVGDVEPLVGVRGPGVRALEAAGQMPPGGRGQRPEAEGAVDVDPGTGGLQPRTDLVGRVEGTGVHVACLDTDDGGAFDPGQLPRDHPPLTVHGDPVDPVATQAEHAECLQHAHMDLVADDDADRRRPEEPLRFDVPALRLKERVTRRGETGEVGGCRAAHEPDIRLSGQAEHGSQPASTDLLQRHPDGRGGLEAGVLVPRRGQDVGAHRGRQRPADDEPEEPAAGRGDRGRRADVVQFGEDGRGSDGVMLQRHVKPLQVCRRGRRRRDAPRSHLFEIADRPIGSVSDQLVHRNLHVSTPSSRHRSRSSPCPAPRSCA